MIVQLKESRDRWLGVANVADFATLASLKRNNYASYKYDVNLLIVHKNTNVQLYFPCILLVILSTLTPCKKNVERQ